MKNNEWINIDTTTKFIGSNIFLFDIVFMYIYLSKVFIDFEGFLCSLPYLFSTGLNVAWAVLLYPCEIMHIRDSLVYMFLEYLCMKLIDGVTSYPFKL